MLDKAVSFVISKKNLGINPESYSMANLASGSGFSEEISSSHRSSLKKAQEVLE